MASRELKVKITGDFAGLRKATQASKESLSEVDAAAAKSAKVRAQAEAELNKEVNRLLKETSKAADREAKEQGAIFKRELDNQARARKQFLADEIKAHEMATKEAKRAADQQVRETKRIADQQSKGFSIASFAAGQFKDAVSSVVGQFTLLNVGQSVIGAIVDSFRTAKEQAYEATKFAKDYHESLLQIAALKGRLGDTTTEAKENIAFRSKTLQSRSDATAFQSEMLNVGQASIGHQITKGEFDKLMESRGAFQAAEGGSAEIHGRLAGLTPTLMNSKSPVLAADAIKFNDKLFNIMQFGGFKAESGARQLAESTGLVTSGAFNDASRMTAMLSSLSTVSPDKAGTMLEQVTRGTLGAVSRKRSPGVMGESVVQGDFWKSLGVTEASIAKQKQDPLDLIKILAADLAKQEALSAGKGEKFDAYGYLQHKGYGNVDDIKALLTVTGQVSGGSFAGFEARAASEKGLTAADLADPDRKDAATMLARFNRSSPVAISRRAETSEAAAKLAIDAPRSGYDDLNRQAFSVMAAKGVTTGDFNSYNESWLGGGKQKIIDELLSTMMAEANRVGIKAKTRNSFGTSVSDFGELGSFGAGDLYGGNERTTAATIMRINTGISERGGNVSEALQKKAVEIAQRQLEAQMRAEARASSPVPAALPAAPAAPMRRP